MMTISITISGYLVGSIWMPAVECFKHVVYDATDRQARSVGKMTLRDHLLAMTNDRDFQSCNVAGGELTLTAFKGNGHKWTHRSVSYPLDKFPSIADMIHPDPDWAPIFDDEEEPA
jgi:hypothetical protein